MKTTFRWCVRLAFLSSLAILLAVSAGVGRRRGAEPLRFQPNPFVIDRVMRPGGEYDVGVEVANGADESARIIGSADNCTPSGCFSGRGLPATIPAGGRGWVIVHIAAGLPGDCAGELAFYTDRPSQPSLTLNLKGTIRDYRPEDGTPHAANP